MLFSNLFHIFRRFKVAFLLNILGMSIAFASFILIMMQVSYETDFNEYHKNADRIYRIESCIGGGNPFYALSARPVGEAFRNSSRVENIALIYPVDQPYMITIRDSYGAHIFKENFVIVNSDYPKVFTFDMLEGSLSALESPDLALLSESLAKKLFSHGPAMGQTIELEDSTSFTVGGIYRDFPRNATTKNVIYVKMNDALAADDWNHKSFYAYALVDSPEAADSTLFEAISDQFDREKMSIGDLSLSHYIRLNNIKDAYYTQDVLFDFGERGSKQTTYLLICIAFIIILIAGINYTNFSTALTPLRIKNINTRKVMGSSVSRLRLTLIAEAVVLAFVSFCIGVCIIMMCRGTFIQELVSPVIDLKAHIPLIATTCGVSILSGILAGLYPSFYLTSFSPALVLKGSFGLSPRGMKLRTVLLCIQYVASIVLLCIASFMILQNKHMTHSSLGYDNDQIVTAEIPASFIKKTETFFQEVKKNENIQQTAYAQYQVSCTDDFNRWRSYFDGELIVYYGMDVSKDFLKVLGIEVDEGRDFTDSDMKLPRTSFIFNEKAKEQYGLDLNRIFNPGTIVGFMPDFRYATFRQGIEPLGFSLITEKMLDNTSNMLAYFRISKNAPYKETVDYILATLKQFDPIYPFEIINLDSSIENAYRKEQSLSSLITLFSILTILISIVGIFGLVLFETIYKRKEIGVRKILGSTTGEIMNMFCMQYIRLIVICCVIAVPISYYTVSRWLDSFTYRTPIYWWVFVLAFLAISLITLLTISYQNYRAASANPIESLKTE